MTMAATEYPALDSPAPVVTETAEEVTEAPAPDAEAKQLDDISALAKAEKAKWREKQRLRAEAKQFRERDEARERQLKAMSEELRLAQTDTLAYAEKHGVTPEKLADTLVRRGTTEWELEKVRAELQEVKDAAAKREAEERRNAYKATVSKVEDDFHALITSNEEKHPTLAGMPKARIIKLAHELAQEVLQTAKSKGYSSYEIDPAELAELLEKQESEVYSGVKGKTAKRDEGESVVEAAAQGAKAATPRTLTNVQATQRASTPVEFDKLSEREQNKILAQQLRERLRG